MQPLDGLAIAPVAEVKENSPPFMADPASARIRWVLLHGLQRGS